MAIALSEGDTRARYRAEPKRQRRNLFTSISSVVPLIAGGHCKCRSAEVDAWVQQKRGSAKTTQAEVQRNQGAKQTDRSNTKEDHCQAPAHSILSSSGSPIPFALRPNQHGEHSTPRVEGGRGGMTHLMAKIASASGRQGLSTILHTLDVPRPLRRDRRVVEA
jgi:hypothetical protein